MLHSMYASQSHQNLTKEKIIEKYGNTDSSLRIRIKNQGYLFIKHRINIVN